MLKFFAKVWAAGEIDDFRRARKKKKKVETLNTKERKRIRMAKECNVDEILRRKENKELRLQYEKCTNIFTLSILISFLSTALMFFIPPLFIVGVLAIINAIVYTVKREKLKQEVLEKEAE